MSAAGSNDSIPLRLASGYVRGLQVARASNTTLTIAAGQCRDSSDEQNIVLSSSATVNFANAGVVNGIDTGAIGASKLYYVYVIANSLDPDGLENAIGGLVSLSATPLLPVGYDIYRRVGWVFSDASSHLLAFYQSGEGMVREYWWDTSIQVLNNGSATALTAVDLSSAAPVLDNMPVYLGVEFTPATAEDYVSIAPAGSSATALPFLSGVVASKAQKAQLKVVSKLASGVPKVQYINSAAVCNTDLFVNGFQDTL